MTIIVVFFPLNFTSVIIDISNYSLSLDGFNSLSIIFFYLCKELNPGLYFWLCLDGQSFHKRGRGIPQGIFCFEKSFFKLQ